MNAPRVCLTMYCIAALVAAHALQAAENPPVTGEAEQVTVTAEAESLTSQSPETSAKQRSEIPGAFTIKTADEMKNGRHPGDGRAFYGGISWSW